MNGTNKATVGVVFGIALVYAALCFMLTLKGMFDNGTISLFLFAPHEGVLGYDLSQYEYTSKIVEGYNMLIDKIGNTEEIRLGIVVIGFVLAVAGMFTRFSLGVKSEENPAEYLWTKRPKATVRGIFAPFGLIGTCWMRSKPLAIIPIILLPIYAIWSIMIVLFLIVPFLLVKGIIGSKVRKAAKKESKEDHNAVCPKCKRQFPSPKIKCNCGLILDFPVPNEYGYKTHTCLNGHKLPCVRGMRSDLRTVCPYCHEKIDTREAIPVSIALVGASGSGKTTLMLATVKTVTAVARTKDISVDASTPGISETMVKAKDDVAKTSPGELDSECLFIRSRDFSSRELIFNDISGTEFEPREGKSLFQEYFKYCDGIVFTFDPMLLINKRGFTPETVFESFHSTFTSIRGVGPSTKFDTRFAVVATKNDLMRTKLTDGDVRQFLIDNGQESFITVLEALFKDVRYFAASSKGEDCASAAVPIWWIAEKVDKELVTTIPIE